MNLDDELSIQVFMEWNVLGFPHLIGNDLIHLNHFLTCLAM